MGKFLDMIGITDPWVQIAFVGLTKQLTIFSLPALVVGFMLGRFL